MIFIVLFLVIPFVEIAVFMQVGEAIGVWQTLFFAFLTAIIGGGVIRYQGLQTFQSAQKSLQGNDLPVQEIFDGFCLVAAGALLITPGFVTDTIGFLLLVPPVRVWLRGVLGQNLHVFTPQPGHSQQQNSPYSSHDSDIIDVEFERMDEKAEKDRENPDERQKRLD